ncbi:aldose 1-epimerase [Aquirufa sp. ROCK-SH2]
MIIEQNPQGDIVSLINPKTQERADINLSVGATLIKLELLYENTLESIISIPGEEKFNLSENNLHPSAILAPWVNRVRNGNYSFLGRNYQLPINEKGLGNAIHGFLARKPFVISSQISNNEYCEVILSYEYDGKSFQGFPFPFVFNAIYRLNATGKFEVNFQTINTGNEPMPFACGWHPYFSFPNTSIKDYQVAFSAKEKYLSDPQMIPFKSEKVDFKNGVDLRSEQLDNVFLLEKLPYHVAELKEKTQQKSIFIGHSSEIFPYFVAFIPEGYDCLAMEPMTANTDAFNTFEGLLSLESKDVFNGKVDVWIGKSSDL